MQDYAYFVNYVENWKSPTVKGSMSYFITVGALCGWSRIRTRGGLSPTLVFKTRALNHSAIHPYLLAERLVYDTKTRRPHRFSKPRRNPLRLPAP